MSRTAASGQTRAMRAMRVGRRRSGQRIEQLPTLATPRGGLEGGPHPPHIHRQEGDSAEYRPGTHPGLAQQREGVGLGSAVERGLGRPEVLSALDPVEYPAGAGGERAGKLRERRGIHCAPAQQDAGSSPGLWGQRSAGGEDLARDEQRGGGLATAWPRIAVTTSPEELRAVPPELSAHRCSSTLPSSN